MNVMLSTRRIKQVLRVAANRVLARLSIEHLVGVSRRLTRIDHIISVAAAERVIRVVSTVAACIGVVVPNVIQVLRSGSHRVGSRSQPHQTAIVVFCARIAGTGDQRSVRTWTSCDTPGNLQVMADLRSASLRRQGAIRSSQYVWSVRVEELVVVGDGPLVLCQ